VIEFIAERVGAKPTHIAAFENGRIVAIRATCGGRRRATVADPGGAIRRGQFMGRHFPTIAVFIVGNASYAAPTLARLRELVAAHGPGSVGHRSCLAAYNSTMACGADHGDCGSRACAFSERSVSLDAETAWAKLNGDA